MLIGVLGIKQSGKDTVADYLVKNFQFKKLAFAAPLKEVCRILFNFDDEQLYGSKKEEIDYRWNITPRNAYQYIGTDLIRHNMKHLLPDIGNNFWVKLTIDNYHQNKNENTIISDVRFQNEIDAILNERGVIIKIIRPKNDNKDEHESEKNITDLKGNYEIINDGSIEDLYRKIDIVLQNIQSNRV